MSDQPNITVHSTAYHRNGVAGVGFYACHFTDHDCDGQERQFIATVFPPDPYEDGPMEGEPNWFDGFHNPRVAVLALDLLPSVEFGHNSWRGDRYADKLYHAILEEIGTLA